jgi:signal transduction histidine kinase
MAARGFRFEKLRVSDLKPGVQKIQLNGLFGHLCSSTGMYSRETFQSLYSCITRMVRDHRMPGFVITRTLQDEAFETMAHALDEIPEVPLFRLNQSDLFPSGTGICDQTGFLIVLTNRLCATLFWSAATHATYRMYEGGWTFHPGDTRTIAGHLIAHLNEPALDQLLKETSVDRRYDEKLNVLITSLVHGLENRNRELMVALDQVQLLNKRNVDTERLAAIGQLSSVIAHEIRNPLGLIDLYAKLTEDHLGPLNLEAQTEKKTLLLKNLGLIRQATSSLETILSELTNYSRPLNLNPKPTDLVALVQELCEFYRPSYQEKSVTLNTALNQQEEWLTIDSEKIRQALINLLKNALEASGAGMTVQVSVEAKMNHPQICVKVSDQGTGISSQHVSKLFTPYFSTKGSGTGLGLAHSRKILLAHGGSVELLSSTPGQGSVFAITLPRTSMPEAL